MLKKVGNQCDNRRFTFQGTPSRTVANAEKDGPVVRRTVLAVSAKSATVRNEKSYRVVDTLGGKLGQQAGCVYRVYYLRICVTVMTCSVVSSPDVGSPLFTTPLAKQSTSSTMIPSTGC
jgi:hypothetical protein